MSEDQDPVASSSLRRRRSGRARLRARSPRAGFAIGPILYLLALIGIGAGILFSGYSQILRSNVQITENMQADNDLSQAATVLASSSILGSTDNMILCPPTAGSPSSNCSLANLKLETFAAAAAAGGSAQLPTNYASAGTTGTPAGFEVGVFAPGSGMKQLDPYGHYYVVCRWERSTSDSTDNSIQIMSAGSDGVLNTPCGNTTTTPANDDQVVAWTAPYAVQHSAIWQTTTGGGGNEAYFGNVGHQLNVDANGDLTVPGFLSVTGTATFGNIGTFAGAVTAPTFNGNFIGGTVSGTNASFTGTLGVTGNTTLGGTLGVTSDTTLGGMLGVTGATTLSSTLGVTGATTLSSTLGVTGNTTLSGALAVTGTAIYGTTTGEQFIVDPLGTAIANGGFVGNLAGNVNGNLTGSQSGGSISATTGSFSGVLQANAGLTVAGASNFTLDSAGNGTFAGTVTAANFSGNFNFGSGGGSTITGVIPLANGGTGIAATSDNNLLYQLGVLNSSNYLNMNLVQGGSVLDTMLQSTVGGSGGTFYSVTVNAEGIVTGGSATPPISNYISDGNDSVIANGGQIDFTTSGTENDVINSQGWLGILTTTPVVPLTVGNPYAALNSNEVAQFASGNATSTIDVRSASGGVTSAGILGVTTSGTATTVTLGTNATSGTSSIALQVGGATEATIDGSGDVVATNFDGNLVGGTISGTSEALTGTLTGTSAYFSGTVTANNISANSGYFSGTVTATTFSGNFTGSISMADGTVTAPGLYFTNEPTTGLFRPGTDRFGFAVGGVQAFELETAAGAADYLTITPATSGSAPAIGAAGSGTNISINLTPKGTGGVSVATGPLNIASASSGLQLGGNNGISVPANDVSGGSLAVGNGALAALQSLTTAYNTAVGYQALNKNTTGYSNTAIGFEALYSNLTGQNNIAIGAGAAFNNKANVNIAIGSNALDENINGGANVAIGADALFETTTAYNTAVGTYASYYNTTGQNVALGYDANKNGTIGTANTALGSQALESSTTYGLTGSYNTAVGDSSMTAVQTTANENTAVGQASLYNMTTGANNVALGYNTGAAVVAGSNNILIGSGVNTPSGTDGSNQLNIGGLLEGNMSSVAVGLGKSPQSGAILDLSAGNGTGNSSMILPGASTANRPGTGIAGMLRYNSDTTALEAYLNGVWTTLLSDTSSTGGGTSSGIYLGTQTTANPAIYGEPTSGFYTPGANTIAVETAGNTALTVTSSGYVGIGTTSPGATLAVQGNGSAETQIGNNTSYSNFAAVQLNNNSWGGNNYNFMSGSDVTLYINRPTSGDIKFRQNNSDQMDLQSSTGNLGIGLVSPSDKLDVAGGIGLTTTTATLPLNGLYSSTTNSLSLTTSGATRLTVTSTGGVGIGTTAPDALLSLGAAVTTIKVAAFDNGSFLYGMGVNNGQLTFGAGLTSASGTPQMVLTSGGTVAIGTTSPTAGVALDLLSETTTANSSLGLPGGSTTNRPTTGVPGMLRYNSSTPGLEAYYNGAWQTLFSSAATISSGIYLGSATTANPQISGEPTSGFYTPSANTIAVETAGNTALTITSSGYVGIGTTAPTSPLHVYTTGTNVATIQTSGSNAYLYLTDQNGTAAIANSGTGLYLGNNNGYINLRTKPSGSTMFLTTSGFVGIGTNSPSDLLDVNGGIGLTATTSTLPLNGLYSSTTNSLSVTTSGATAMTITSTGSVGIGTTSPNVPLQVGSGSPFINTVGAAVLGSSQGFLGQSINGWGLIGYNSNTPANEVDIAGPTYGLIVKSGNVGIGTTAPANKLDVAGGVAIGSYAGSAGISNGLVVSGNVGLGTTGTQTGYETVNSGGLYAVQSSTTYNAIYAMNTTVTGTAATGAGAALFASATGASNTADALYATNSSASGYAIYANGNTYLNGTTTISGNLSITGTCTGCSTGAIINLGSVTIANPQVSGEPTSGFYTNGSNTIGAETAGSTALYITATQSVGIGTTAPAAKLDVYGSAGYGAIDLGGQNGISVPTNDATGGSLAVGNGALAVLNAVTTGYDTAVGYQTLNANTTGKNNTALGYQAGVATTTGTNNVYIGYQAGYQETAASNMVAIGSNISSANSVAGGEVVIGSGSRICGGNSVDIGYGAGNVCEGGGNAMVSIGYEAAQNTDTGGDSVAVGYGALTGTSGNKIEGIGNTGLGYKAGAKVQGLAAGNTFLGYDAGTAVTTGSDNVIIGPLVASTTLSTGSNNILIGTGAGVDTAATNTSNILNIGGLLQGNTSGIALGVGQMPQSGTILDLSQGGSSTNSAMILPGGFNGTADQGTSSNRPTGLDGMIRYDSTTPGIEAYINGAWTTLLADTSTGTNGNIYLGSATTANPQIFGEPTSGFYTPGANTIAAETGGSTALTITATQSVGIGTTAPASPLEIARSVSGTVEALSLSNQYSFGAGQGAYESFRVGNTDNLLATIGGFNKTAGGGGNGYLVFYTRLSNTVAERMRIDNTGNVGIGTTTIPDVLDVNGGIGLTTTTATLPLNGLYSSTTNSLSVTTSGATAMTITSTGSVGIGTTAPAYPLDVAGGSVRVLNGTGNAAIVVGGVATDTYGVSIDTQTGTNGSSLRLNPANGVVQLFNGTLSYNLDIYNGNTPEIQLSANGSSYFNGGNIGIGTSSPAAGVALDLLSETTTANSSLGLPGGSTTNRPTTGVPGMLRYNSSTPGLEAYYNGAWQTLFSSAATISSGIYLGSATTANPQISGEPTSGFYTPGANTIAAETAGSTALTITATQSVGIGTTSPSTLLQVSGGSISGGTYSSTYNIKLDLSNSNSYPRTEFFYPDASAFTVLEKSVIGTNDMDFQGAPASSTGWTIFEGYGGSGTAISTGGTANPIIFTPNRTEAMRITATGSVGIGTTAPGKFLQVNSSTQYQGIRVSNGTNSVADIVGSSASNDNGEVVLYSSGTQNAILSANGNSYFNGGSVGIGTTATQTGYETVNSGGLYALQSSTTYAAVSAMNTTVTGTAATGAGAALFASATGASNTADALYATNSSATGYAGYFNGAVNITGNLNLTGTCTGCSNGAIINLGSTTTANPQVSGEPTSGFYTNGSNTIGAETAGSTALYITATQSVGIGTTSPLQLLDVDGVIAADGTNAITGNPPAVGSNVGWKLGLYGSSFAFGIAANTLVARISSNQWFSIFGGSNPANNATSSVPDTNSVVSFGANGNGLFSGFVGIGTTSPSDKLDVAGGIGLTTTTATLPLNGLYSSTTNSLSLTTSGARAMTITSTGSVGIGTTAPATVLEVQGAGHFYPSGTAPDNSYHGSLRVTQPATSGQYINLIAASTYPWSIGTVYSSPGTFAIGPGQGTDSNFTGSNIFLDITATGSVGIGTTAPGNKLSVVAGTEYDGIFLGNGTHSIASLNGEATGNDNGTLQLLDAGTVYVYIPAAGNGYINNGAYFGIGTTAPANKLDVAGGVAVGSYAGSTGISNGLVVSGNVGLGTTGTQTGYETVNSGGLYALQSSTTYAAVSAMNTTVTGTAATGAGAALFASATGASNTADALYATNSSASGYAIYAHGNTYLNGTTTIAGNLSITGTCVGCAASPTIGTVTTASPYISGEPTSGFYTTAANVIAVEENGVPAMQWNTLASGTDYLSVTPGNSSNATTIAVTSTGGSNTNPSLTISTTGAGDITLQTGTNSIFPGSFAAGYNNTIVSGSSNTALGYSTRSVGFASTAMGYTTTASGINSTAMDQNTVAAGSQSTAMGEATHATGTNSTSMGYTTTATSYDEVAMGQYNALASTNTNSWVTTDPLFEIGNGSSTSATSDAMVVYKNGDVTLGSTTSVAGYELTSNGGIYSSQTSGSYAGVYGTNSTTGGTVSSGAGAGVYASVTGTSNTADALYALNSSTSGYAIYASGNAYLGGTTTIAGNLNITGTCVGCAASPTIGTVTTASPYILGEPTSGFYTPGANTIGVETAGSTALTITATQSIGIGTTAPGSILQVQGNGTTVPLSVSDGTYSRFSIGTGYGLALRNSSGNTNAAIDGTGSGTTYFGALGGDVGIGTTAPNYTLDVEQASTATSGTVGPAANATLTVNPGGASSALYSAGQNYVNVTTNSNLTATGTGITAGYGTYGVYNGMANNGTGTVTEAEGAFNIVDNVTTGAIGSAWGAYNRVYNYSTGTISNAYGSQNVANNGSTGSITSAWGSLSRVNNGSTGTVTTAYSIQADLYNSGTVGTWYGLYIPAVSGTAPTTAYDLYIADTNNNYIAGKVGIGTTAPTAGVALDLLSETTTSNSSLGLPGGSSTNRPTTGVAGMIRYNSTTPGIEAYYSGTWNTLLSSGGSTGISLIGSVTTANPEISGEPTSGFYTPGANTIGVETAGTTALTITATQSVGIGTTAPHNSLSLSGDEDLASRLYFTSASADGGYSAVFGIYAPYGAGVGGHRFIFYDYANSAGLMSINDSTNGGGVAIGASYNNASTTTAPTNGLAVQGNVGIGTTAPAEKLDVVTSGNPDYDIRFSGGASEGGIGADSNGFTRVAGVSGVGLGYGSASGGTFTEVLRATTSGYVGIGTTAPAELVDIAGGPAAQIRVTASGTTYGPVLALNASGTGGRNWALISNQVSNGGGAGSFALYDSTDGITALVATDTGSVGIGTTAPITALQVVANATTSVISLKNASTAGWSSIDMYDSSGNQNFTVGYGNSGVGYFPSQAYLNSNNTHPIVFGINGSEKFRLDTTGNVGIGSTSPTEKLDVQGTVVLGTGTAVAASTSDSYGALILRGSSSNLNIETNDGGGRVNYLWNANGGSSSTYLVSSEPAAKFAETVNSTTGADFQFGTAPAGTAGGTITWTQMADINGQTDVWFSPRGTSSDFYINNSGEIGIGLTSPGAPLDVESSYAYATNCGAESSSCPPPPGAGYGTVLDSDYDNGQYRYRLLPTDRGGNISFYVQEAGNTANSFSNIARFGTNQYDGNSFAVFGAADITGNLTVGGTFSPASISTGALTVTGPYIYMDGGTGAVNSTGGPFFYADNYNTVVKIGSGAGGLFVENYAGAAEDYFATSGSSYLMAGNVGIGTTTPAYALDVVGVSRDTSTINSSWVGAITGVNTAPTATQGIIAGQVNGNYWVGVAGESGQATNGVGVYGSASNATAVGGFFTNTAGGYALITNAGNVGIGTTAPGQKLTVYDSTNTQSYQLAIGYLSGNDYDIGRNPTTGFLNFTGTQATYSGFNFSTANASNALTIINNGEIGIGSTTPGEPLDVNGIARTNAQFISTASGAEFRGIQGNYGWFDYSDGTNFYILLTASGSQYGIYNSLRPFYINLATGAVTIDGTAAGTTIGGNITLSEANPTITSGSSYIVIPNGLYVSGGTLYSSAAIEARGGIYDDVASYLTIGGGTSGYTYFGGSVGIGTTAPAQALEVNGIIQADSNWIYTTGATGWYNATYGGGWYMTDSSWIRSYNGKYMYEAAGFDTGAPSGVGCSGALGGGYTFDVCGTANVTSTLSVSGNIYWGSGGNYLSAYLNQGVLTTSSPTFANVYVNCCSIGWLSNILNQPVLTSSYPTFAGVTANNGTGYGILADGVDGTYGQTTNSGGWGAYGYNTATGTQGLLGYQTWGVYSGGNVYISGDIDIAGNWGATSTTTCGANFVNGIFIGYNDSGCGGGGGGGGGGTGDAGDGGGDDVAEYYGTEGPVPQRGDIVAFTDETFSRAKRISNPASGETATSTYKMTTARMAKATDAARGMAFGVVPTAPGLILDGKNGMKDMGADARPQLVALAGHVPVRMTLDGGDIAIGDPITVSTSTPSAGMKASGSGRIIGWALEPMSKTHPSATGMIEVFVTPQDWTSPADIRTIKADNDNLRQQVAALQASVKRLNLPVRGADSGAAKGAAVLDKISWKVPGDGKTAGAPPAPNQTISADMFPVYFVAGFGGLMLIGFACMGGFIIATRREMRKLRKAMPRMG